MRAATVALAVGWMFAPACSDEPTPAGAPDLATVEVEVGGPALGDEQSAALRALGATTTDDPGAIAADPAGHGDHGTAHDDDDEAPPELDRQLDTARRVAVELAGESRLWDRGYHVGSYWSPGVGTHYIDWRLVGDPFDPAHPAMLLVDTAPGHRRQLAGLSYWVRSDGPPEGFAGSSDVWHNHRGMCFIGGVLAREGVTDPASCDGTWIDGQDLWMLHVWVVPGFDNPDGVFASANPSGQYVAAPNRGHKAVVWAQHRLQHGFVPTERATAHGCRPRPSCRSASSHSGSRTTQNDESGGTRCRGALYPVISPCCRAQAATSSAMRTRSSSSMSVNIRRYE